MEYLSQLSELVLSAIKYESRIIKNLYRLYTKRSCGMLTGVASYGRMLIKMEPEPYSYSLDGDSLGASMFIHNGSEMCGFIIDVLKEGLTND